MQNKMENEMKTGIIVVYSGYIRVILGLYSAEVGSKAPSPCWHSTKIKRGERATNVIHSDHPACLSATS